ncbi:MAG: rRNA pseudouridine synthase [Candidatus Eisenbacteria bacterium]|nr:rRNA pseudouridine synthase [Candidatus Eisenbacteria bacterium]
MRLNRFLAQAGLASRRQADTLIAAGRVTVNGETVARLGTGVDPDRDSVALDGRPVALPASFTYVLLNKPPGFVVTMSDPQGRRTAAELVSGAGARVVPVGRLDAATEGLLLLTDDGELAHRVAHPSFELDKVYRVEALGVLSEGGRRTLEAGVELDGRTTAPAVVRVLSTSGNVTAAETTIHEGRKRQVRRMFEAVGHRVTRLVRIRLGPLALGDLPSGQWRPLTTAELGALRQAVGLAAPRETPCPPDRSPL